MNKSMPTGGIARHIDDLGRLVIPKEIRRRLGWNPGTLVNMLMKDGQIICSKVETDREIEDTFKHLIELLEDENPNPINMQTIKSLKEIKESYTTDSEN